MHCTSPKNNFRLLGSGRSYWGNKLLTLNSHNFFDTWNWGLKLHQSTQNRELRRSTGSKPISRLRRCSPQGVGIGRGTRGACSETVANIDEILLKFRCFLSSQISAPRLGFFYQTFSRSVVKRRLEMVTTGPDVHLETLWSEIDYILRKAANYVFAAPCIFPTPEIHPGFGIPANSPRMTSACRARARPPGIPEAFASDPDAMRWAQNIPGDCWQEY